VHHYTHPRARNAKDDLTVGIRDMIFEEEITFGERLRRLREADGLTQEKLASRAGMTAKAVSALERGERKRPYPHTLRSLADALGLSEEERASLLASVPKRGAAASSVPAAVSAPEPRLPAPTTPILCRERDVEEIRTLLRDSRLLTLTGTGGVGKTRLVTAVAWDAAVLFPDGIHFVGLASLDDPDLVLSTIAHSLGLRDTEGQDARTGIAAHLEDKKFLLVLDNFEHVLEAASGLAALIENCPNLTVLVTSRAPLRVRGEQEYPVQPLALPASTRNPAAEEVEGSPSGRLFVERARAASPAFEISGENASAVAAICWRLGGLPLALELAAARTRFLAPGALLSRLDRALSAGWARDLPDRQRTMPAALDWSYNLLTSPERALFRRLSVFAGGFTLEAAEGVCATEDPEDVLLLLGNLVEQSLVVAEPGAGGRYRMLEPIRQYTLEKLKESGEEKRVRDLHADYYLAPMEKAGPGLKGPDQGLWVRWLMVELDNTRAALAWATENGGAEKIADAVWASWTFWWTSGNLREGRRRMEAALAADLADRARAKLLFVAATLGQAVGDFESTWPMIEESRELFERLGDRQGVAYCLGTGGLIALGRGDPEKGLDLMQQSVNIDLELGDKWSAAAMLGFSATVPFAQGDFERARQFAEHGLELAREVGARDILYVNLHPLAEIALAEGKYERARQLFEEGANLSLEVGEKINVAFCLDGLAAIAASEGKLAHAARLWGAAEEIRESAEVIAYPYAADRASHHRRIEEAHEKLDESSWRQAWDEGRAMSFEKAIAHALKSNST
jgi:predicted ATPase/DNA-binding XRE family transcriptional regulator